MKHWTQQKRSKPTVFQQVQAITDIDNKLMMRSSAIGALYKDLDTAKSEGYRRYITNQLIAFGEGDKIHGYDDGEQIGQTN